MKPHRILPDLWPAATVLSRRPKKTVRIRPRALRVFVVLLVCPAKHPVFRRQRPRRLRSSRGILLRGICQPRWELRARGVGLDELVRGVWVVHMVERAFLYRRNRRRAG